MDRILYSSQGSSGHPPEHSETPDIADAGILAGASPRPVTGALEALVVVAQLSGVAASADHLAHMSGEAGLLGSRDIVRLAKQIDLKARLISSSGARLPQTPLPAIAELRDGRFVVLVKCTQDACLLFDAATGLPQSLSLSEFEAQWSGRLILITSRATLAAGGSRFGIGWFVPSIVKYRKQLGEVLAGSFFLQLFGLVSPLFMQVVIDKVLVHKSVSTLDVLVFGFVVISIFETLMGGLRTYVFSHTTNRIDVELGARLFKHLLGLPLAYFQARRVGDSVARVRELENIRNFLTGNALTLVMDLVFTLVFFAVMLSYSALLTGIVVLSLPLYVGLSCTFFSTTPFSQPEATLQKSASNR